jgi:hypothetical protein
VDVSYECVQQSLTDTVRHLDTLTTQVLELKATSREERQKAVGLCTFPHNSQRRKDKIVNTSRGDIVQTGDNVSMVVMRGLCLISAHVWALKLAASRVQSVRYKCGLLDVASALGMIVSSRCLYP